MQTVRYVLIIPNVILVFYNILQGIYTNALRHIIELTVIFGVAIKHLINKKRKAKNINNIEQINENQNTD